MIFDTFVSIARESLPDPDSNDFYCQDYTDDTSNCSNVKYVVGDSFTTVCLRKDGTWEFHFNGFCGKGASLEEAEKNWKDQESDWFYKEMKKDQERDS